MSSDLARAMTEADMAAAIIDKAQLTGWLVCHVRPAWTEKGWRTPVQGDRGLPDLILARRGRVLFLELKQLGKYANPEQEAWIIAINGPEILPNAKVQAYQVNTSQLDVVLGWLE